ncbi:MAG: hypothetical protein HC849_05875 [Oscillatoriales cyanobacterium RU_3_3]|nr:hypothetical protein [Oscillatoriales cyanobacterium RU_3_3]
MQQSVILRELGARRTLEAAIGVEPAACFYLTGFSPQVYYIGLSQKFINFFKLISPIAPHPHLSINIICAAILLLQLPAARFSCPA